MSKLNMVVKNPTLSTQESQIIQKAFFPQWILASTLGWILGLIAFIIAVEITSTTRWLGGTMASIVSYKLWGSVQEISGQMALGAGLGTAQWFVLRRKLHKAGWWILASSAGIAMGWLLEQVVNVILSRVAGISNSAIGGWATFGIVLGVTQWFVLRARVHRAGWWILGSLAALVVGVVISNVGDQIANFFHFVIPGILAMIIFGTARESITGIVLLWLFRISEQKKTHLLEEAA